MIDNYFTEALRALASDGAELRLADDGAARIETEGVALRGTPLNMSH